MNDRQADPPPPLTERARPRWPVGLLAAYWCVLFLATHWPNPYPPGGTPDYPDKLVHFTAYAVLAFLGVFALAWVPGENGDRVSGWRSLGLLAVVIAYGLFDEVTQPITGRDFEWLDWAADCAGSSCGALASVVWNSWRLRASEADSGGS